MKECTGRMVWGGLPSGLPPQALGGWCCYVFGGVKPLFQIFSCCCVTEGQPPQPSTTLLLRVGVNPPTPIATPVLVVW